MLGEDDGIRPIGRVRKIAVEKQQADHLHR